MKNNVFCRSDTKWSKQNLQKENAAITARSSIGNNVRKNDKI
jgi:hypothetical protein